MSQTSLDIAPCRKAFVRDLADGQEVESPFVVRERTRRQKRNGESFLKLRLGDCTGVVEAVVWEGVEEAAAVSAPGAVVLVSGRYSVEQRYGSRLTPPSGAEAQPRPFALRRL